MAGRFFCHTTVIVPFSPATTPAFYTWVVLIWHYLAHNQKIVSKRTNIQLEKLKNETIELVKQIESAKKFPPNTSALCHWCEYKNICPAWNKDILQKDVSNIEEQTDLNKFPITKKYIIDKPIENNSKEKLDIWD